MILVFVTGIGEDSISLHSAELHSLYRSPIIVRMIKSIRMRWAAHIVRM
jgi:hypothetical protein